MIRAGGYAGLLSARRVSLLHKSNTVLRGPVAELAEAILEDRLRDPMIVQSSQQAGNLGKDSEPHSSRAAAPRRPLAR